MQMVARASERDILDNLLASARSGLSGSVVVTGEAGIGKTSLLDYAADAASGFQVVRASGVESDSELGFAALHQLCGPAGDRFEFLPAPQASALAVAFGSAIGGPPDRFLVGVAVLSLLSDLASGKPVLWVIDDAQWLDQASAQVLAFVARRLEAESVVMVFGVRSSIGAPELSGIPEMAVTGLADQDARDLLAAVLPGRVDDQVLNRILAEAQGNPLALVELPRAANPTEFGGGFAIPDSPSLAERLEASFRQRIADLPDETRMLMLLAAAEPIGDPGLLWRGANTLGLSVSAAEAAETADLIHIGRRVQFRHPLVRSAIYASASGDSRRAAHQALADATDIATDPDRRAWHRAAATIEPTEDIAADLERSAQRAAARGGIAASAAFMDRATMLTPDPARRAARALEAAQTHQMAGATEAAREMAAIAEIGPLSPLDGAKIELLRAQTALYLTFDAQAPQLLAAAARRLAPLDATLSRETYLEAFEAAIYAGRLGGPTGLHDAAVAAKNAPAAEGAPRGVDLLLDGLAARFEHGGAAGFDTLRAAVAMFRTEPDVRWLWTAMRTSSDLWDMPAWEDLSNRQVQMTRDSGSLSILPIALNNLAGVQVFCGRFDAAAALIYEADAITAAIGAARVPYAPVYLAAWRGTLSETEALIAATVHEVNDRGEGFAITFTQWALAVQLNGLGRYDAALEAAMTASEPEEPGWAIYSLVEVIEAAIRTKRPEIAHAALDRLSPITRASDTDWGLGVEARSTALLAEVPDAEALYLEAIERLARTEVMVELARSRLVYGEWLRRQRRRTDARHQLRIANDLFSDMGAEAFAERARAELVATGEHARKRSSDTRLQLTPQQAQIARLASEGGSNQEIASQLFISPRTVEYHLYNVFKTLGIDSRHQLAAALHT